MIEVAFVAAMGAALAWLQASSQPVEARVEEDSWARWEAEVHDWQLGPR